MLDRLLELETEGWDALTCGKGADYYGEMLTDEAVMVVPGAVLTRDEVLASFEDVDPWSAYEIEEARVVPIWAMVTLVYRVTANARRAESSPSRRASPRAVHTVEAGSTSRHHCLEAVPSSASRHGGA